MFVGALGRDVSPTLADDNNEFHLIVELVRHARHLNLTEWRIHGRRLFAEPDLLSGCFYSCRLRFLDVIGVVEADRENLSGPLDWGKQPHSV